MRALVPAALLLALVPALVHAEGALVVSHDQRCTTLRGLATGDACTLTLGGPLAVACEGRACAVSWEATLAAERADASAVPSGVHLHVRPVTQTFDARGFPVMTYGESREACDAQGTAAVVACGAVVTGDVVVPEGGCAYLQGAGRYLDADPGLASGALSAWAWTGAVTMGVGACDVDGGIEASWYTVF